MISSGFRLLVSFPGFLATSNCILFQLPTICLASSPVVSYSFLPCNFSFNFVSAWLMLAYSCWLLFLSLELLKYTCSANHLRLMPVAACSSFACNFYCIPILFQHMICAGFLSLVAPPPSLHPFIVFCCSWWFVLASSCSLLFLSSQLFPFR